MSQRMSYQEKQARAHARARHKAIFHEVEDVVLKVLQIKDDGKTFSTSVVTIKNVAQHLVNKFQITSTQAHAFVSLYVASRSDLFVTKGKWGGIHKLPVNLP